MKISEILSEANPHHYDSDVDYYAALNKEKHDAKYPRHHPKPQRPMSDQDIEGDIADRRITQANATAAKSETKWDDQEGETENGHKYNRRALITSPNIDLLKHEVSGLVDYHHGAKKLVGQKVIQAKMPGGPVKAMLYFVDNHKYGMWKPWPDQNTMESATAGATSAANIGTVDAPQLSPGKARGKKSYIGDPWGGKSGTKAPPQPKVVQPKNSDGTAKNGLDMKGANLFGGPAVKRS